MEKIQSLSTKRLIVQASMNGMAVNLLVDTGASVGLVSSSIKKKYKLVEGRKFPRPLVGAGGEFSAYFCNTPAMLKGRTITQFLLADISAVIRSIKQETGVEIQGIISLPQMQFIGMNIDANDNLIILE